MLWWLTVEPRCFVARLTTPLREMTSPPDSPPSCYHGICDASLCGCDPHGWLLPYHDAATPPMLLHRSPRQSRRAPLPPPSLSS
jgi:hypothetical protein